MSSAKAGSHARHRGLLALAPWFLAVVVQVSGCNEKTPCDDAFLTALVAAAPAEVVGKEAEEKERIRISVGIRDACPNMADWTRARMMRSYEGLGSFAEPTGAWLENEEPDRERKLAAPLRERVCPNFDEIVGVDPEPKPQPRGIEAPEPTAQERQKALWHGCNLGRFGLYAGRPKPGQRGPTGIFDFSVFLFLKDGGIREVTAIAAVRGLGKTVPPEPRATD